MGEYVNEILKKSIPVSTIIRGYEADPEASEIDDKVDILYSEIVACLARISSKSL